MTKPRAEQEIFEELGSLATLPEFAHIIAYFCAPDNFTWYKNEMREDDMQHLHSRSRLKGLQSDDILPHKSVDAGEVKGCLSNDNYFFYIRG